MFEIKSVPRPVGFSEKFIESFRKLKPNTDESIFIPNTIESFTIDVKSQIEGYLIAQREKYICSSEILGIRFWRDI
jgi:hypothetical protein